MFSQKKYDWKSVKDVIASLSELVGNQTSFAVLESTMHQRQLWKKYRREIEVHAKGYLLPKIREARPNENEHSLQNRLLNYEPVTTPYWTEAITKMKRILIASTVDIMATDKTKEFARQPNFNNLSLYDFFATEAVERTINEPNGLTVIYPLKYIQKDKDRDKDNPIQFVNDREIIYLCDDTIVFLSLEKSEYSVNYDNNLLKEGITYNVEPTYTYTGKRVYHIFRKGEFAEVYDRDDQAKEWIFDIYKTGLDFIPCFQNGGIKVCEHVYKSFFHDAIGFANKALSRASDNDAVDAMYSFPITEMVSDECNSCNGVGHTYKKIENNPLGFQDVKIECERCKGTGEVITMSPYKVMLRKRAQSNADPIDNNVPAVQFYSPDPAILEHSSQNWQDYLEKFKSALHVIERRDTKQVESGFSIEKQYEPLYDFMHNVGMTLYNNLERILMSLQGYLEPTKAPPSVTRPISYHLVEEGEAFTVLSTFLEKDMPTYLRRQYIRNFVSKYVGSKSPILKYIEILEQIDPYLYYTTAQKNSLKISGGMNSEQYRVSISAFGVMTALSNDPKFKDAEIDVLKAEILKIINEFKVDAPPQSTGINV